MTEWRLVFADFFVIAGALTTTLAVVSLLRIPDAYAKMHATAKAVVLGVLTVLAATVFTTGTSTIVRAAVVGGFLLLTAPVGAHVLARLERLTRTDARAETGNLRNPAAGWPGDSHDDM